MSKLSMAAAAKIFAVSRPTLLKHLKQGKITGEKVTMDKNTFWKIDPAELARVYPRRDEVSSSEHGRLTKGDTPASPDLQAENNLLRAQLEAAEQLAEERRQHLDDLRKLLPTSGERPARRRWWRF